jgi:ribosomal protein S2
MQWDTAIFVKRRFLITPRWLGGSLLNFRNASGGLHPIPDAEVTMAAQLPL